MTALLHEITYHGAGFLIVAALIAAAYWLQRGAQHAIARHRARVMHPCNGEARRLPQHRATAERVAELDEWLEGR